MLLSRSIFACVFSNTLYALATVWYAYITHLGYRGELRHICSLSVSFKLHHTTSQYHQTALPFLGNTQVFLWYPVVAIGALWSLSVVLVVLGLRVNLTRIIMAFHFG